MTSHRLSAGAGATPLTVRQLTIRDVDAYRTLRLEALQTAPHAFGSTYEMEIRRERAHFERRLVGSAIFGAFIGARLVGSVALTQEAGPKERHKGSINGLFVELDARRRGVAAALLQAVIAHAAGCVELLTLAVVEGQDTAIRLYQNFGFVIYGVQPRSLKSAEGYRDEVLMVKLLAETGPPD